MWWNGISNRDEEHILTRFVALEGGDPQKLTKFIDTYGGLNLCQHGVPAFHPAMPNQTDYCRPIVREPVWVYQVLAREVRGIVGLMRELKKPLGLGRRDDWEALYLGTYYRMVRWKRRSEAKDWEERATRAAMMMRNRGVSQDARRAVVARSVSTILRQSSVEIGVMWSDHVDIALDKGVSVAGLVGVALLRELGGKSAPVLCRGCPNIFIPSRKGWRFCEECRATGVPNRVKVAEHRARKRARTA